MHLFVNLIADELGDNMAVFLCNLDTSQYEDVKMKLLKVQPLPPGNEVSIGTFLRSSRNPALSLSQTLNDGHSCCINNVTRALLRRHTLDTNRSVMNQVNLVQMLGLVMLFAHIHDIPVEQAALTLQAIPGRMYQYSGMFPAVRTNSFAVNGITLSPADLQSLKGDNELHDQVGTISIVEKSVLCKELFGCIKHDQSYVIKVKHISKLYFRQTFFIY